MNKDNLPEEQTPRTEEAAAEQEETAADAPAEDTCETSLPETAETAENAEESPETEDDALSAEEKTDEEAGEEPDKTKKERRRSDSRKLRFGAMATGLSVIVIAAVVLLNVVVGILADRFPLSFDLTKDKTFSLSEQGIAVADNVKKDVEITVFAEESLFSSPGFGNELDTIFRQFYQMAREYSTRTGGKVKVSYVDLTANPTLESQYTQYGDLNTGSILFVSGDRHQLISYTDLFSQSQSYTSSTGYAITSLVEQKLASCINAVSSENQTVITLLTGHGEDTTAMTELQKLYELNGYTVETVDFTTAQEIHKDSKAVVLAGPTKDFTEEERNRLQEWLSNDGNLQRNLLLFCSYRVASLPVLYGFVESDYGIQVTGNLIQETNQSNMSIIGYNIVTLSTIQNSDLTADGAGKKVIFPNSLQLVTTKDSDSTKTNPTNVPLITYTNTAKLYKLADLLEENEESEAFDADSYPITAMAYAEKQGIINGTESVSSHVMVCGSLQMTYYLSMSNYYNENLLIEPMNTVTGNTDAVVISGKALNSETLDFSNATTQIVGLGLFTIGIPAVTLIICLLVFLKRRHL